MGTPIYLSGHLLIHKYEYSHFALYEERANLENEQS